MTSTKDYPPHVLSNEEIDMYLKGDRRDVDRLLLYGLNRLTAVIVPHAMREETIINKIEELGGLRGMEDRAVYVNSMIKKNADKSAMMEKVTQSVILWVLIAFLGFMAHAVWGEIVQAIKAALITVKVGK